LLKAMVIRSKSLWGISMIGLLGISYWLCRYTFFDLHGMKQWPNLLAFTSIFLLVIAAIFGNRIISAAIVIGYMGGFIIAMIFNTDDIGPHGGRINNAWIIWGAIFLLSILIGFVLSLITKKLMKK
jgi:hypothetical protein